MRWRAAIYLQVLLVSIFRNFAIAYLGKIGEPIAHADRAAKMFFGCHPHHRACRAARCSRRDGVHGRRLRARVALGSDRADRDVLSDSALFVLVVLSTIARFAGFSIIRFIAYIRTSC
jgi:aerobic C4-dicarboxylate transport protein